MGMAAVRRKQFKSQQLQPVAAAVSTVTADKTNSFLMIGLLPEKQVWRARRAANGRAAPAAKRAIAHCGRSRMAVRHWAVG
jgi:hypothetical protein